MSKSDKTNSTSELSEQSKRFIEAARELECDEDEEAFNEVVKRLASTPPPKTVQAGKAKRKRRDGGAVKGEAKQRKGRR